MAEPASTVVTDASPEPDQPVRGLTTRDPTQNEETTTLVASKAVPEPPSELWRVQLASLPDGATAQSEWQRLQQIHPLALGDQPLHIERVELDRGTFFRIQAGAFDTAPDAEALCNRLKGRGQDCLIVR